MNDLISRSALKEEFAKHEDRKGYLIGDWEEIIDNAPPVEVPEDEVNCVLTMFGKCSYNETGCSDCEIKDKIRKALNARPQGEWITDIDNVPLCKNCGEIALQRVYVRTPQLLEEVSMVKSNFCPNCGADMRKEAENE